MAIYRNISLTFWEDSKIVDDFTPEDRYFLLYLLTNPHTNLIGCYEVSIKQMTNELGFNDRNKVEGLLIRMEQVHKIILYSKETKEVLIKNWHKYNWTKSEKLKKPLMENIENIKSEKLKKYMISIGYKYGMYTTDTVSDTDTVSVTDIYSVIEQKLKIQLSPLEIQELQNILSMNVSEELVIYAIDVAISNKAYSVKYVSRILHNWRQNNVQTVEQAKKFTEQFNNKSRQNDETKEERDRWENE